MAKLEKKIGIVVTIPEVWEREVDTVEDEKIVKKVVRNDLGGGKIKVFSLTKKDIAIIQAASGETSFVRTGDKFNTKFRANMIGKTEATFLARTYDNGDCYWEGFYGPDDQPLNCTEKNLKLFAFTDVYQFVEHVGAMLDSLAVGEATEEEKNLLNSLAGCPDSGNDITQPGVSDAKTKSAKK